MEKTFVCNIVSGISNSLIKVAEKAVDGVGSLFFLGFHETRIPKELKGNLDKKR